MSSAIRLLVGLGNPGRNYQATRHNAGVCLLETLARNKGATFSLEKKYPAYLARLSIASQDCRLCRADVFMNNSGKVVRAVSEYYKIQAEEILIIHDDIDLPPGEIRLKQQGGHGGHNGLRDIITQLSSKQFVRLRIGVGRPANSNMVTEYVLQAPTVAEKIQIKQGIDDALMVLDKIVHGELALAMNDLHNRLPDNGIGAHGA